jgi:hypothetical protein
MRLVDGDDWAAFLLGVDGMWQKRYMQVVSGNRTDSGTRNRG